MNYQVKNSSNRIQFVFYNSKIDFEEFSEIIDQIANPDFKSEIEITSWTQAFSFHKNEIEIYFEYFYDSNEPHFHFELLPFGNDKKDDLSTLQLLVDKISNYK